MDKEEPISQAKVESPISQGDLDMALITLEDGTVVDAGLLTDTNLPTGQISLDLLDSSATIGGSGSGSTLGVLPSTSLPTGQINLGTGEGGVAVGADGPTGDGSVSLQGIDLLSGLGGDVGTVGADIDLGGGGSDGGDGAGGGTGDGGDPTTRPATQGPLPDVYTAFDNIFRQHGAAPEAQIQAQLDQLNAMVQAGTLSQADANLQIVRAAAPYTGLAVVSYAFFTGQIPSLAGIDFLVNSQANPTDLNDRYYDPFNTENRYINFSSNLGLHGEGTGAFVTEYGSLSFEQAVEKAYVKVIGMDASQNGGFASPTALNDIIARKGYFDQVATERFGNDPHDLAVKLAAIGYILQEAVRSGVGLYGDATENFLFDLGDGQVTTNVDLVGTYGSNSPVYNVD
jgi:hypothetical protein